MSELVLKFYCAVSTKQLDRSNEQLRAERDIHKRRVWEKNPFDSLTPELLQYITKNPDYFPDHARVLPIFKEINFDPRLWALLTVIKSRRNEDAHTYPFLDEYEVVMEDYFDTYFLCRDETPEYGKEDFLKAARVAKDIAKKNERSLIGT
ncbi:hypothetical protein TWF106_010866 [Orbilia oligospora]|uniref:Uncharacterized protein n=1 Tax=Orbilia oligospora TaxID=2813651 RepID=A0A7C8QHW6_ORBOL|nr:hypothetical protein TWF106_010866 [Orbilia oligospora]